MEPSSESKGFPGWAIALIVIGGVAIIGAIVIIIFLRKRKRNDYEKL